MTFMSTVSACTTGYSSFPDDDDSVVSCPSVTQMYCCSGVCSNDFWCGGLDKAAKAGAGLVIGIVIAVIVVCIICPIAIFCLFCKAAADASK